MVNTIHHFQKTHTVSEWNCQCYSRAAKPVLNHNLGNSRIQTLDPQN